ncbi:MAG: hypothetical protein ACFFD4_15680 [Candidatus Odinarchaeota archaeon]
MKPETRESQKTNQNENDKNAMRIAVAMASFTDRGMEIRAQGDTCKELFSDIFLQIVANYSSILCQQVRGEHLLGAIPLPQLEVQENVINRIIDPKEWYYLIYIFSVKDKQIKDERIIKAGSVTVGIFLVLYSRKFDFIIMKMKQKIKDILSKASGLLLEVNSFSEGQLSLLEHAIRNSARNLYKNTENVSKQELQKVTQIRKSLEYQKITLDQRLTTLMSLSRVFFTSPSIYSKGMEKNSGQLPLFFVYREPEIVAAIGYHVPPFLNLEGQPWKIRQKFPGVVELTIAPLKVFFLTSSRLKLILEEYESLSDEILGIYFGTDIDIQTKNYLLDSVKKKYESSQFITLGIHEHVLEGNAAVLLNILHGGDFSSVTWHQTREQGSEKLSQLGVQSSITRKNVFHQLIWFYDITITRLMEFITKNKKADSSKMDTMFSAKERTELKNLFSQRLNDGEDQ